jgi:hypothetical protein
MSDSRLSILRGSLDRSVQDGSPGGGTITPSELTDMKKLATAGTIALVDINNLDREIEGLPDGPEKSEQQRALGELRGVATVATRAQGDAIGKTLAAIDTINPFAYARWALGGTKPGLGTW